MGRTSSSSGRTLSLRGPRWVAAVSCCAGWGAGRARSAPGVASRAGLSVPAARLAAGWCTGPAGAPSVVTATSVAEVLTRLLRHRRSPWGTCVAACMQERLTLKHKNTSRWARRALKRGTLLDDDTKAAVEEQLRCARQP